MGFHGFNFGRVDKIDAVIHRHGNETALPSETSLNARRIE